MNKADLAIWVQWVQWVLEALQVNLVLADLKARKVLKDSKVIMETEVFLVNLEPVVLPV